LEDDDFSLSLDEEESFLRLGAVVDSAEAAVSWVSVIVISAPQKTANAHGLQ
jgi:hypothetical protein